jgi:hypothetical protein
MNYLKFAAGTMPASTFPLRKSGAGLSWPENLSKAELKRIVAEALG